MSRITFIIIQLSITVTLLHLVAVFFYLYWFLWWFDTIVHLVAGIWVGFVVLWVFFYIIPLFVKPSVTPSRLMFIFLSTGMTTIVAIVWELFELSIGVAVYFNNYMLDTSFDLLFGMIGGAVAGVWGYYEYNKKLPTRGK